MTMNTNTATKMTKDFNLSEMIQIADALEVRGNWLLNVYAKNAANYLDRIGYSKDAATFKAAAYQLRAIVES